MADLPANPSARYRTARFSLFSQVISANRLDGVILAHHADDQAETIVLRLLRGRSYPNLGGMQLKTTVSRLTIWRPLLDIPRQHLRDFLVRSNQPWREDSSNESSDYLRNRIRQFLSENENLKPALLELGRASRELSSWIDQTSPRLEIQFPSPQLANLPRILARHASRKWLIDAGASMEDLTPSVLDRLILMARDASTPGRVDFPNNLPVHRRAGRISRRGE
jgi:tRNA(Ile)-lysidine synthase TilS/MesJ